MALSITILLFPFSFLLFFFFLVKHKSQPKLNLPPGPRQLPIIGNLHQVGLLAHRSLHRFARLHGPIMHLRLGRTPTLVVSSAALAGQVLKTHDTVSCSRPPLVTFQEYSFGGSDVAVAAYGDKWRSLRKIFLLELLSPKKTASFRSHREAETDRMILHLSTQANPSSLVNVSELAMSLTNNIINRVAFGCTSEGEYGERSRMHGVLEEAQSLMASFFVGDYFPGFGWVDVLTGKMRRLKRNSKKIDEFYQEVIDEHMNREKRKEGHEEDIVDVLIRIWREGPEQLTMDHIKGALMNILFGGTDTSAATVTWTMAELAKNPRVMKKAQDEMRRVIGSKGKVEETDLSQLQYLKLVVNETFRLHPPFPLLIPREVIQHFNIDGYDVRANTRVLVNAWAIGRDEGSWENAEEYTPERFEGSSIEYKGHDFELIPFGAGRRVCPGLHFGVAVVELALANLLYAFNWELPVGMKKEDIDMMEAPGVITQKKVALYLVATRNN